MIQYILSYFFLFSGNVSNILYTNSTTVVESFSTAIPDYHGRLSDDIYMLYFINQFFHGILIKNNYLLTSLLP